MFDLFSWSHILILLTVALVVVGPKDLPRLMHMAGKWMGKARSMASEFRRSFDEMARQTELDELRKEIEDLKKNNPVSDISREMQDLNSTVDSAMSVNDLPVAQSAEAAAESEAPDTGPEPRSGEFAVTESAPPAEPVKTP
jgi:sec-independent protein translocase protein TatB